MTYKQDYLFYMHVVVGFIERQSPFQTFLNPNVGQMVKSEQKYQKKLKNFSANWFFSFILFLQQCINYLIFITF